MRTYDGLFELLFAEVKRADASALKTHLEKWSKKELGNNVRIKQYFHDGGSVGLFIAANSTPKEKRDSIDKFCVDAADKWGDQEAYKFMYNFIHLLPWTRYEAYRSNRECFVCLTTTAAMWSKLIQDHASKDDTGHLRGGRSLTAPFTDILTDGSDEVDGRVSIRRSAVGFRDFHQFGFEKLFLELCRVSASIT